MKVKNLVLGVGIFIIYMLMLGYGIEVFYASPKYEDYCDRNIEARVIENREIGEPIAVPEDKECYDEFNNARDDHSKNVFVIALIVGLITLVFGYKILSVEPVGSALIASGIGAIFFGAISNWRNFSDILRFLLLVFAFVFLIWITLRLNKKRKNS